MRRFEVPEVEIVWFDHNDIMTASTCVCVDCKEPCPEGKDNCQCVDFAYANQ